MVASPAFVLLLSLLLVQSDLCVAYHEGCPAEGYLEYWGKSCVAVYMNHGHPEKKKVRILTKNPLSTKVFTAAIALRLAWAPPWPSGTVSWRPKCSSLSGPFWWGRTAWWRPTRGDTFAACGSTTRRGSTRSTRTSGWGGPMCRRPPRCTAGGPSSATATSPWTRTSFTSLYGFWMERSKKINHAALYACRY